MAINLFKVSKASTSEVRHESDQRLKTVIKVIPPTKGPEQKLIHVRQAYICI
jgi:hypothetical protein